MASATTISAAAMVMTKSGSTLPAAQRSAPAAWVATSSTSPPLSTSSTPTSSSTALRRTAMPNTPSPTRAAASR